LVGTYSVLDFDLAVSSNSAGSMVPIALCVVLAIEQLGVTEFVTQTANRKLTAHTLE
jgi:hypothetical protein